MRLDQLLTRESFELALSTLEAVAPEVEKAAPTGALTLELETIGKDGSRRWYEVRLSLLRERGGPLRGFLAVARDVTSRHQTQRELARLATAVDQAAEAVILTDLEGAILYVNPAFERITGYTAAEAMGQNPRLLKSGLQDRAFYAEMWSVVRSGKTWEGRFTNRRKDGGLFVEDASISPIREHESGRLIGYVALKRDVTRQVQLEAHLAQTQKMEAVGRLAAGVAHDFNNMLAAILGLADVAVRRAGSDTRLVPLLTGIREAALRAGELTRQILTFSRQSPTELRPVELGPVVEEAVRLMRNLLPSNVEVRESLESRDRRGGRSDPGPPGGAEPRDQRRPRHAGEGRRPRDRPRGRGARRGLREGEPAHPSGPLPPPHRARRRHGHVPGTCSSAPSSRSSRLAPRARAPAWASPWSTASCTATAGSLPRRASRARARPSASTCRSWPHRRPAPTTPLRREH